MAQSVAQTYRREGTLSEGNKKRIRSQESKKQLRAKQMRRRASHPAPHCSWIIQVAFPPLRAARQRYQSDSARKRVPHLPVLAACQAVRRIAVHATFAAASGPTRSKNRKWRRPQCPGNRYALARVFQFPLAIHLENCQSATSVTANHRSTDLKAPTFSLNPLCGKMLWSATLNRFTLVQKLWRMTVACGRLRKTVEKIRRAKCRAKKGDNFHGVKKFAAETAHRC